MDYDVVSRFQKKLNERYQWALKAIQNVQLDENFAIKMAALQAEIKSIEFLADMFDEARKVPEPKKEGEDVA